MSTSDGTSATKRGFAAISPEQRREIASRGGKAAHAAGMAHRFTTEEAQAAGRKGGQARKARAAGFAAPEQSSATEAP